MASVGCFDLGVLWDRDRVGRAAGADGRDHVIGEEPRVGAHRHSSHRRARRRTRARVSRSEAARGRAETIPTASELCSTSPVSCAHRHQRVIAQHLGMAVRGAVLGPAAHLTHRGVQIHGQLRDGRRGAHRPRPRQRMLGRFVELAHMPERERPQERPRSRRRHHRRRAAPHPTRPTAAGRCRRCSGRPPASTPPPSTPCDPRPRPPSRPDAPCRRSTPPNPTDPSPCPPATTPHRPPKTHHRTPPPTRRSHLLRCSQEVPPHMARMTVFVSSILPCQEAFLVDAPTPSASPHRWIQA